MKNQKGITLITLAITIALIIILTFTLSINIEQYSAQKNKSNFESDMTALEEEINQYYARVKEIPIINKYTNTTMLTGIKNVNDNDEYYVIDINQLEVNLNNGHDYKKVILKDETEEITDLLDVYIINAQSHTIYYPKGVNYKGKIHYTLDNSYSKIYNDKVPVFTDVSTISLGHAHVGSTSSGGACYRVASTCGIKCSWNEWRDSNGNITGGDWGCGLHGCRKVGWGDGTPPICGAATSYAFNCSIETLGTITMQFSNNTKIIKLRVNVDNTNNYISNIAYTWTTENGTFENVSDEEINLNSQGTYKCTVTYKDAKTNVQYTKELSYTYTKS